MPHHLLVIVTTSTKKEATKIVRCLLEERLIACANIISPVSSMFWWKDRIDETTESLILMKSHSKLFEKLSKRVKEIHSYDVPEILSFSILKGLPSYLNWLETNLQLRGDNDA